MKFPSWEELHPWWEELHPWWEFVQKNTSSLFLFVEKEMTRDERKRLAQSLFVGTGLTRKVIAQRAKTTEATLRKWIDAGGWVAIKEANSITRSQLLEEAYNQLHAANKKIEQELGGVVNKEMSDVKAVIRKEIEVLSDRPLHNYIEVAMEFTAWLEKNHPKNLLATVSLLEGFISTLANKSE